MIRTKYSKLKETVNISKYYHREIKQHFINIMFEGHKFKIAITNQVVKLLC